MQSVPFHIAYLLTQYESVIVPGLGAFIVSLPDKDKTSRWGILSPPVYSLEFDPGIKHNDGLLANSIEEERQHSYSEVAALINRYVTHVLNALDRRKSVHIPWVGILYQKNNRILFEPDKVLSCNAINYGLTGFSLPYVEDLRHETAVPPKQNKAATYLKQSSITTPSKQNSAAHFPRQNSVAPPKQNNAPIRTQEIKKENFFAAQNRKLIIIACAVVALVAMLMIFTPLNKGLSVFSPKKNVNIIKMPALNLINDDENASEEMIQVPTESTAESKIESTAEPAKQPVKQPAREPAREPAKQPVKEEPAREPVRQPATTVESAVTQAETPINRQETISQSNTAQFYYYIIVASWPNEIYARNAQAEFHSKGFRDAGILYVDNKYRIYVNQFEDRKEAERFLVQFRQDNPVYESAWIMRQ